jgi:homoserine dehydrogenase
MASRPRDPEDEPTALHLFSSSAVRPTRVALAGCGVVGSALVHLLEETKGFELVRVLVRDPARVRPVALSPAILTTDPDEFLRTEADVVVEALGAVKLARRLATRTIAAGGRYVTANMAMIAEYGPPLVELAALRGTALDFGAAVGGCLPVVRLLRDGAVGSRIEAVRGILNGTTNYLLDRMAEGLPLDAALAEARTSGFAEANLDRDLSGQDAADKIAILAWLAFGSHPGRLIVRRRGLGAETSELCGMASAVGGTVKLIAEAVSTSLGVVAAVEPVVVDANSAMSSVRDEGNLVEIWSWSAGVIQLQGTDAGGLATATALYADLLRPAAPVRPIERRIVPAVPDPRELRWLVMVPEAGDAVLQTFCRTHRLACEGMLKTARPRARSLTAVRCTVALLEGLLTELEGAGVQARWVRWEKR